ncbi:heavy metal translocating P-type ATPase [Sneathiella chinensis]|uniref:Copper-translocating P-type ATPase n=1 Tax=Sneathiella chinensis TaxID=349750 RepID=A0ABQ5U443_9PROT|nr:heavy metal translocating P-type ATPase [Sneathiella chinensis]GLQ06054.1 copper-translocating P-type ATPase [Sneathiella chinensis]
MNQNSSCCGGAARPDENAETALDPVCGMTVTLGKGKPHLTHEGEEFHFCSQGCHDKFEVDPEFYLTGAHKKKSAAAPEGTKYTCPMHPEIISDHMMDCPLCGMALEPMGAPSDEPNPELIDFTRRFWVSVVFAIPVVILAMGPMLGLPIRDWMGHTAAGWAEAILATPVVLWAAWPFFKRGWGSIVNKSPNMWTLIAIGVGTAYVYSLGATLFPDAFPAGFREASGSVPIYFEAAVVIIALVFLGQLMELKARERTGDAIRALLDLSPKTARRINANGSERDVPVENILAGDKIRLRPGESIPVDGVLIEGHSTVDESMITGEPIPVAKAEGDKVSAGTLNKAGSFVMEAEKVGSETLLASIVNMVADAQRSRAPIQSLADKVAGYFVPMVVAVAIIAFGVWSAVGPEPRLVYALLSAVSVLIIACPCALGLATPMSIMTATGLGAQRGVLVRDAEGLETLSKIDTVIVDKTGTLTEGKPQVTELVPANGTSEQALLRAAASMEVGSEHPLAEAILKAAEEQKLELKPVSNFQSETGMGVTAHMDGTRLAIGSQVFMDSLGIDAASLVDQADTLAEQGKTTVFVGQNETLLGLIAISDPIKKTAFEAIAALHELGVHIIMATGDTEKTALAVARQLKIDQTHASMRPADKKALVDRLRSEGNIVAMAGDGINDAPALASANVGIAMGSGTDVAIGSSSITLLKGDLTGVTRAYKLSRKTLQNIKQNLFFAFAYNFLGVPIAAGILYPVTGTLLSPMIAAAAMSLSSVSVITNALRLRKANLD